MEQKEFRIKSYDGEFRIKKMNAIELLGIRSQIDFDNLDSAIEFFKIALEHIEVKIGNDWVPVKMKNREATDIRDTGKKEHTGMMMPLKICAGYQKRR